MLPSTLQSTGQPHIKGSVIHLRMSTVPVLRNPVPEGGGKSERYIEGGMGHASSREHKERFYRGGHN